MPGIIEETADMLESEARVSPEAAELFSAAFSRIIPVVEDSYLVSLDSNEEAAAADVAVFLQSGAENFGRSLEAVYRYGLWRAMAAETCALAESFMSRGLPGRLSYLLKAWIMAISSGVRSPEVYSLVRPLEILRERAASIENEAAARRAEEPEDNDVPEPVLEADVDRILDNAKKIYESGGSLDEVLEKFVYPVLAGIGRRWTRDAISVAGEHAATAAMRSAINSFFDSLPPAAADRSRVAVTCVPGDEHELGAEILSRYLERRGWRVFFIGHSFPEGEIVRQLKDGDYLAVLLSVSMIRHLPSFEKLAARLKREFPGLGIIAGGGAVAIAEELMNGIAGATVRYPAEAHRILASMEGKDA